MKFAFFILFLSMFIVDACNESRESEDKQPADSEESLMVPDSVYHDTIH